jgi:hypothetical protein
MRPMPTESITGHPETAAMVRLTDQLTKALRGLIASSPLSGLGPIELARALSVDKTLTSRLMAALRATDQLAALSALPGTGPLRQFVRSARRHGASAASARAAEAELRAFDRELQRSFGTRTRLDAAIADALPQTRQRHQESARQAVYRGMALIKGVSIDLASVTWIVHPSPQAPEAVDIAVLAAFVGIRRLRPTARVRLGSSHRLTRPEAGAKLLPEFCRPADLSIETTRDGEFSYYEISSGPVRRDASTDVFLTERLREVAPRTGPADERTQAYGTAVAHACKRVVLNILVHETVWPGCEFTVRAYDTAVRGPVYLPDPSRDADRLDLDATTTRSIACPEALASFPLPGYPEVMRRLTAPLGIELSECRMFSCEVVYPTYGSQVFMVRERAP